MNKKVTAGLDIERINRVLSRRTPGEIRVIADFLETFATGPAPLNQPLSQRPGCTRDYSLTLIDVTDLKLIIRAGLYDFFTPTVEGLGRAGIDMDVIAGSVNIERGPDRSKESLIIYSAQTKAILGAVGSRLGIEQDRILLPNREQTDKMRQDTGWSRMLTTRGIYWILFLLDPKNPDKNVSLEEWSRYPGNYTAWQRPLIRNDKQVYEIDPDSEISSVNRGGVFFAIRAGRTIY